MTKWLLGGMVIALLCASVPAAADSKTFDELYMQGVRLKKTRRFQEAIQKFAAAKAQADSSDTRRVVMGFWALGTTYEAMYDCANAISTWEEYVKFADGKPGERGGVKNARQKIDVCKKVLDSVP